MRGLALILALGALSAGAARPPKRHSQAQAFELLPGGTGAGIGQTHLDLAALFPDEMTGNWFQLLGDGTQKGPVALATVGAPVTENATVYPCGPDGCTFASQRTGLNEGRWKTGNTTAATVSFSVCWFGTIQQRGGVSYLLSKWNTTGSNAWALLGLSTGDTLRFAVRNSSETDTNVNSTLTVPTGQWTLVCGTHDALGAGSSVSRLYVNGVANGTPSTTAVAYTATTTPIHVGGNQANTSHLYGRTGVALYTEKVLSADTIAAMDNALRPKLQGTRGEAVTNARTTVRSCCNAAETSCVMLAAGRSCVRGGTLHVQPTVANLLARSREVDVWTAIGTPTEAVDAVSGPDGTKTADTIGDDDASAEEGESRVTSTVTAGQPYALSCWLRAGTSSAARLVLDGTTCNVAPNGTWTRYSCTDASASGTTITAAIYPTDAATESVGTVHVADCQVNAGTEPLSYCPTAATAPVTCNADNASASAPSGVGDSAGCLAASVLVPTAPSGTARVLQWSSGGYLGITSSAVVCNDGTNTASATIASPAGRVVRARCRWRGTTLTAEEVDVASGTATYDGALTGATLYAGSDNGSNALVGGMGGVRVGSHYEGCP